VLPKAHRLDRTEEIPFGAIERPERQEFPAQNWIDYADSRRGLILINRGIPGNNVADGKLMLSLARSTRLIAYPFIGGYEPGVRSDTALGIGRRYTLEYALLPHARNWRAAAPWRAGMEFNNPLIVDTASPHQGELPARRGLLEISHADVAVPALKPAKDGMVALRVYEAAGKPADGVHVLLHARISQVHESNLIEDDGAEVRTDGAGFSFDLRPFEIKTFKFRLEGLLSHAGQAP
jgi:alpha-mannosidase